MPGKESSLEAEHVLLFVWRPGKKSRIRRTVTTAAVLLSRQKPDRTKFRRHHRKKRRLQPFIQAPHRLKTIPLCLNFSGRLSLVLLLALLLLPYDDEDEERKNRFSCSCRGSSCRCSGPNESSILTSKLPASGITNCIPKTWHCREAPGPLHLEAKTWLPQTFSPQHSETLNPQAQRTRLEHEAM